MKLLYNKKSNVHRFDIIGDLLPSDIDVLKNSLMVFFDQLNRTHKHYTPVVIDLTDCAIKVSETKLQLFISEVKTLALASQCSLIIAQSDIESIHAEQKAVEMSMKSKISLLQSRLELVESVKKSIHQLTQENEDLRKKINRRPARHFFEKLWG